MASRDDVSMMSGCAMKNGRGFRVLCNAKGMAGFSSRYNRRLFCSVYLPATLSRGLPDRMKE
ncbi:MAG: hypothetical protein ACUVQQ_02435, partial [Thermogutta sp.]